MNRRLTILSRLIVVAAIAMIACEVREPQTTAPEDASPPAPSLEFTGGSGTVLASTREGELVEVDLDAGTATLIGAAAGKGWTDIAFDSIGNLFALSVSQNEPDFLVHLYRINPSTGTVLADIGAPNGHRFSDFDSDGSQFYGVGGQTSGGSDAELFTINESNAQVTWIGSGAGPNPFGGGNIGRGGFAAHPTTGDLWGITALNSQEPVV